MSDHETPQSFQPALNRPGFQTAYDKVQSERDVLAARCDALENALRGWEGRDSDGREPCSIERGTLASGDLEVLVSGLTYEQVNQIEDWLIAAGERQET